MRRGIVTIGIVLAVAGAALWYFPAQPVDTGAVKDTSTSYVVGVRAPLELIGGLILFDLHWSSGVEITISLYDCGSRTSCAGLTGAKPIATETGTSGELRWTGGPNQYFNLVPTTRPVKIDLSYTEPLLGGTAGLGLLLFGGILAGLGAWSPPAPPRAPRGEFD